MGAPSWAVPAAVPQVHKNSSSGKQVVPVPAAPESTNQVVSDAPGYIGNIKIWGTGMMEDPNPGSKRGKGVQHMNSDHWIGDMGLFIHSNLPELKAILASVQSKSADWQYRYFLNQCNMLFMRALKTGLRDEESEQLWLMASWWCMVAAEVDDFDYLKYTSEERQEKTSQFLERYAEADAADSPVATSRLVSVDSRVDLLPPVALERLSLHNELCQVKYGADANGWMKTGFKLSQRLDSLKRHIDEAHHKERHEDAIAHLVWNFMAIYHVLKVHPLMNDLPDFESYGSK